MLIQPSCLKCHGKREDTIPSIRDHYTTAYDYKLGERSRGLLNIKIKEKGFFEVLYADFINTLIITILLYVVFLGCYLYTYLEKYVQKSKYILKS